MAALDVLTSSSAFGEGFPNVVAEGMACGAPCVVTDVGDSADIVGDTGTVLPPGDPIALADGWAKILAMPSDRRREMGKRARARVEQLFSVDRMAEETLRVLRAV
jgi:glycosyltransferase involved in cell wall biosynthesis